MTGGNSLRFSFLCVLRGLRFSFLYARERIRQMLSEGSTCHEVATALGQERILAVKMCSDWSGISKCMELAKSGRSTEHMDIALKKIDNALSQDTT